MRLRVRKNICDKPVFYQMPIFNDGDTVADLLDHGHLMGDDHNCYSKLFVDLLQKAQNGLCCLRVKRRGCLVAEKNTGVTSQCSGNGHSLFLTS